MNTIETLTVLAIAAILAWSLVTGIEAHHECQAVGGTLVRGVFGFVCVRP